MSSSSSLSSSSREIFVYVRGKNSEHRLEFYCLPLKFNTTTCVSGGGGGGDNSVVGSITPIAADHISLGSGCVAVGNTIFCIGGEAVAAYNNYRTKPLGIRSVFSLNTGGGQKNTTPSWKKSPMMLYNRPCVRTVAVNGKIYVFGGIINDDDPKQWAEVFDTKSDVWESLPPPPSPRPTFYGMFAVAITELNKIVLGSSEDNFLYAFDVGEQGWEKWDNEMGFYRPRQVQPVVLGTTLFWFDDDYFLSAYDMIHKWTWAGPIKDLEKFVSLECVTPPITGRYRPTLHHVARNVICLVCLEYGYDHERSLLHCIKFCLSPPIYEGGEVCLNTTVTSSQAHIVKTPEIIMDAVLVEGGITSTEEA